MDKPVEKPKKVKKAKGPIRTGAVVPTLIIFALVYLYFTLFFDGHLRRAIEFAGTQVNGAEVNVGSVSTSFLGASLKISGIQVTDKNKPHRNIVEVGSIQFKMLWDALLRAKVVVDEASILNIQALTSRKKPGYVVPPPPPSKESGTLEKVQSQVLEQTRKQYSENFLGDLASVLGGTDPKDQLKVLENELKSSGRLKELEKELKEKKVKWEATIKAMPQAKEVEEIGKRAKALKFNTKNPVEFARDLKEAEKIYKEAEAKVKVVEQGSKDINSDVKTYTQAFKDVEKMVEEDLKDIQKRLKIPDVNAKSFSTQLFMGMLEQKIVGVRKYVEMARKYMPPKKTKEQRLAEKNERLMPEKRGTGKNFRFPITTGYPLFWLKHAAISSEVNDSEWSGNIKGEIKDLNSDPEFLGRPTYFIAQGDFPKQNVSGVDAKITIDHTTENAKEMLDLKVGSFPVENQVLSGSKDVGLSIQKATGGTAMNATLANDQLTMTLNSQFQNIAYDLKAKEKIVKEILGNILNGIPMVTVNARALGSFSDLSLHINSNLGEELAKGFQKQLQAKIDEAKANVRKMIDAQIGGEKAKLQAELNKVTGDLNKTLDSKKGELDKALKTAKADGAGGKPAPGKALEDEGKKLLKKFGF